MADVTTPSTLLVELPSESEQHLHWWRVADGEVVAHGHDQGATQFEGERVIALVPVTDAPLYTVPTPDLPMKQAEVLAARQLAARALGREPHAVARWFESADSATAMQGTVIDGDRLRQGLAMLATLGLTPDAVIPAAIVARHIWWSNDAEAIEVPLMGEVQRASTAAVFPSDPVLTETLNPAVVPMQASEAMVRKALIAVCNRAAPDFLTGPFAAQRKGQGVSAWQWRTLLLLLLAALLVTMAIGVTSWWRFAAAAEDADARALAALSKAVGPQNDLSAGESALDARLAREGRGAAVMSAPLAALYTAMQGAPQVSLRQLRYTPDGTMLATMAAPTSDAANAILARLQQDGYTVTATARTDDSGAQVVDVTIRGY